MSSPRFTYFAIEGRGFAFRVAMRAAGLPYEDVRVGGGGGGDVTVTLAGLRGAEGWNARVPLGSLPTLELPGGALVVQSGPIARWAGKQAGLWTANANEELVLESLMETANEVQGKLPNHANPDEKKKLREEFAANTLERYLVYIENNIKGPFILGDKITVADVYVQVMINLFATGNADFISPDVIVKKHPKLLAFRDAVRAHPIVQAEIQARKPVAHQ